MQQQQQSEARQPGRQLSICTFQFDTHNPVVLNFQVCDAGAKVNSDTQGHQMFPEGLEYPDQPIGPKVGFARHQDVLRHASRFSV